MSREKLLIDTINHINNSLVILEYQYPNDQELGRIVRKMVNEMKNNESKPKEKN